MTSDAPAAAPLSGFPLPPKFYTSFTEQATASLAFLRASSNITSDPTPASQLSSILDLPPELRLLIPPPPPADGSYRLFGEEKNLSTPLPPLPAETASLLPAPSSGQSPAPPSPAFLIRLTRSILLNFLEFVDILATNPHTDAWAPKWEDLRDLLRNTHLAVNMYREWGAREQLIGVLEGMVHEGRERVGKVREVVERGKGVLEDIGRMEAVLGGVEEYWKGDGVDDHVRKTEMGRQDVGELSKDRKTTEDLETQRRILDVLDEMGV